MLSFRSIQAAPNSIIRLTPALFDIGHSSKLSSYQGPPTSLYSEWRVLTLFLHPTPNLTLNLSPGNPVLQSQEAALVEMPMSNTL